MGGTALKAARHARGWTKPDLMQEMRAVSARVGERLPVDTSMRVSVARWENGHRQPGEFYRWLFCQVYSATPGQLGFPPFELLPEVAPGHAVLTALLYTAPLTTTELATVPPARARMYAACALADPRTPDPADLAAGLDRARRGDPAWLDRARLAACETAAHTATTQTDPPPTAGEDGPGHVPDWLMAGWSAPASPPHCSPRSGEVA